MVRRVLRVGVSGFGSPSVVIAVHSEDIRVQDIREEGVEVCGEEVEEGADVLHAGGPEEDKAPQLEQKIVKKVTKKKLLLIDYMFTNFIIPFLPIPIK